jgi:hypothetical protein
VAGLVEIAIDADVLAAGDVIGDCKGAGAATATDDDAVGCEVWLDDGCGIVLHAVNPATKASSEMWRKRI